MQPKDVRRNARNYEARDFGIFHTKATRPRKNIAPLLIS